MNRLLTAATMMLFSQIAMAHFPMWITKSPFVKAGEDVTFYFLVGHPYEVVYEDADQPSSVLTINSRGVKEKITVSESSVQYDGNAVRTFTVQFQPELKGSYLVTLDTKPSISRNGDTLYQEYIKTVLYVERGSGWEQRSGQPLEIVPLTRPFGLQAGFVFRGRLMNNDKPIANETVYIEHKLTTAPNAENLPPEPLITFEVVTDADGYFLATLPESGWWILASYVDDIGKIEHEGNTYQHNAMAGLWVHVEE